jgi:RimJ/RimL family protein N-acetyltransferase
MPPPYDRVVRSTPIEPLAAPLSDGVVTVRLRRDTDLAAIAAARNDPETERWLDDSPGDSAPRSASEIAAIWRSGHAAPLVIADADTDHPVGLINLQFGNDEQATVAYQVFPERRGLGIAARAVELVTGWAFRDLGLATLMLEIDEANTASIRVAEKCRFVRSATDAELSSGSAERPKVIFGRTAW